MSRFWLNRTTDAADGNKTHIFSRTVAFIIRHPAWTLLTAVVMTALLGWQLPRLSFKTTVYDLVIESLPEARQYNEFQQLFGSDDIIRIAVSSFCNHRSVF